MLMPTQCGFPIGVLVVKAIESDTREASMKKYGGFPMGIQSYSLRGFGVDGALEKINETFQLVWSYKTRGRSGLVSAPMVVGNKVLFITKNGKVYIFEE